MPNIAIDEARNLGRSLCHEGRASQAKWFVDLTQMCVWVHPDRHVGQGRTQQGIGKMVENISLPKWNVVRGPTPEVGYSYSDFSSPPIQRNLEWIYEDVSHSVDADVHAWLIAGKTDSQSILVLDTRVAITPGFVAAAAIGLPESSLTALIVEKGIHVVLMNQVPATWGLDASTRQVTFEDIDYWSDEGRRVCMVLSPQGREDWWAHQAMGLHSWNKELLNAAIKGGATK